MPRKKRVDPISPKEPRYPDLRDTLMLLEKRLDEALTQDQRQLIEKWLSQLSKIQKEIKHLEKLELFSKNLKRNPKDDDHI